MAGDHRDHQAILPKRTPLQAGEVGMPCHHGQVRTFIAHGIGSLLAAPFGQGQFHPWVGQQEIRNALGQPFGQCGGVRGQSQGDLSTKSVIAKLAAHGLFLPCQHPCMPQQDLAGGGQRHAAPATLEQGRADLQLQRANTRTGGRQR
ncbi:UNVERIFIED_ORG: hypothetical protein ABIB63_002637 [Xanthomonas axonopodis]